MISLSLRHVKYKILYKRDEPRWKKIKVFYIGVKYIIDHSMAIDNETRARVYYLGKVEGLSNRKVAKLCGVSQSSVWRICQRQNQPQRNEKARVFRRGKPQKISHRQKRLLLRVLAKLRRTEGQFSVKRLMQQSGMTTGEISIQTVYRFLNSQGYYHRQARKKGLISKLDMTKRVTFARRVRKSYPEDLWTKRIAFYLDGTGFTYKRNPLDQARAPKGRIWRKKSEGLRPDCTAKGRKAGTGGKVLKLMVAISYDSGVLVAEPYEKMTGEYFAHFIEQQFEGMFQLANKERIWVQDGDPCQNSKRAMVAMETTGATLLKIPPRSPDLNPIENFFHLVGKKLREDALARQITMETFATFRARVIRTIFSIDKKTINNLIGSMNTRINSVIKFKGQRLKY